MQRMGLSHADFHTYLAQLHTSHEVRVRATVLDMSMRVIGSITPRVLSGQVLGDMHGFGTPHGPVRRLNISLVDEHNALGLESAAPRNWDLYYDRLVQVHYSVRVPDLGRWVSVPVFTGRPSKMQRTDDVVDIDADDSSVTGMGAAWQPLTIPRGTRKVDAIRRILSRRVGDTRFAFPASSARLAHPVSLLRLQHPWAAASRIAASMNMQLYYTGSGIVTMRPWSNSPCWTFRTGPGGDITQPVAASQAVSNFWNVVEVQGRRPKGSKKRIRAVATPAPTHPLSPQRLGRNGIPYRVIKEVQDDHLRSHAEAQARAEQLLSDGIRQGVDISYSVLPMPHHDPGDLVRAETATGDHVEHRMESFTLPLPSPGSGSGGDMSVGWYQRPPVRFRRIRK